MAEYKTFFLISKLFVNVITPCPFLSFNRWILVPYFCTIFFLFTTLCFIKYKKVSYFKKYLSREYVPSTKLALSISTLDFLAVVFLYGSIYKVKGAFKLGDWAIVAFHLLFTFAVFILLFNQRTRNKTIISYTKHKYRIGIMARDIGENENGLKKGQPVEIISENEKGYVVKDSSNNSYALEKMDIESVLEVV